MRRVRFAPAKINMALHVVGRRSDGYHLLDSLVVFSSDVGDFVEVAPAQSGEDRVSVTGPFASAIPAGSGNILLAAAALARRVLADFGEDLPPLDIRLDKRLPVAAGIGGGSADAAALLRMIIDAIPAEAGGRLTSEAVAIGADVPMCLNGRPARVTGIGETIAPLAEMPRLPLLLVNPGVAVSTPAVFAALERRDNPPLPDLTDDGFSNISHLADWLTDTRNDLEAPALSITGEIAAVRNRLAREGALLARMSGSGATVFALFESEADADRARRRITADHGSWWIAGAADQRRNTS
nr:4-(cytidine 5'-diphospho)-2-C-methyl-D-erythritol kinase [Aurantimonas sp. VKM B-3413]